MSAAAKLPPQTADAILEFTLFNYDNLIADSYETDSPYLQQLAYLLGQATNRQPSQYLAVLQSPELSAEAAPVQYMFKLNKKTIELSGYCFVETDD